MTDSFAVLQPLLFAIQPCETMRLRVTPSINLLFGAQLAPDSCHWLIHPPTLGGSSQESHTRLNATCRKKNPTVVSCLNFRLCHPGSWERRFDMGTLLTYLVNRLSWVLDGDGKSMNCKMGFCVFVKLSRGSLLMTALSFRVCCATLCFSTKALLGRETQYELLLFSHYGVEEQNTEVF